MSAAYASFDSFTSLLSAGLVHLSGATPDTLKVYLSNTTPVVSTMTQKSDLAEITLEHGYTGAVTVVTSAGVASPGQVTIQGVTFRVTASGGTVGPFRYVVLYDSSTSSPANALFGYWDLTTPVTLSSGDAYEFQFNGAANGFPGTIFIVL